MLLDLNDIILMIKKTTIIVLALTTLILSPSTFAANQKPPRDYRWSVLFYAGDQTDNTLGQVLGFRYSLGKQQDIYSIEVARELSPRNPIRHYISPFVGSMALALNAAYRRDPNGPIYEIDPYMLWRWEHFPWNRYITTTFGIGWGLSWVSKVPFRETVGSTKTRKLLDYLMFEFTVASPKYPQLQLVYRIHHRSGAFGLFSAGNSGSTAVGLGIRYLF